MTAHVHRHPHGPAAHAAEPGAASPAPSLLRLSAAQRLAGGVLASLLLWVLVWWAMQA